MMNTLSYLHYLSYNENNYLKKLTFKYSLNPIVNKYR